MRWSIAFILCLIVCLFTLPVAASGEAIGGEIAGAVSEKDYEKAQAALSESYPFDERLYTRSGKTSEDGTVTVEYRWIESAVVIFTVRLSPDGSTQIEYNDTYSMFNYYRELVSFKGLFRNWTVEDKAWMASVAGAYYDLELFRVKHYNPEWIADNFLFPDTILHKYGLPDENSIPQDVALEMAKEWLVNTQGAEKAQLDDYIVSAFYYVDTPHKPQWVFGFRRRTVYMHGVVMDAYTGKIANLPIEKVKGIAKEWLLRNDYLTEDYFAIAQTTTYYADNDDSAIWTVMFWQFTPDEFFDVNIDDATGEVVSSSLVFNEQD